jgi:hypothetical protein
MAERGYDEGEGGFPPRGGGAPAQLIGSVKDFTEVDIEDTKRAKSFPDVTGKHVPLANHRDVPWPSSLKWVTARLRYDTEWEKVFGDPPPSRAAAAMMDVGVQQGSRGIDGQTQGQLLTHRIVYVEPAQQGGGIINSIKRFFGMGR